MKGVQRQCPSPDKLEGGGLQKGSQLQSSSRTGRRASVGLSCPEREAVAKWKLRSPPRGSLGNQHPP
jgi:hypothetical protein